MTPVQAAPNFDQIKVDVEQSVKNRKEFKTNGGQNGSASVQSGKPATPESLTNSAQVVSPPKVEVKIIWTAWGGRIKYWQVGSQRYFHIRLQPD